MTDYLRKIPAAHKKGHAVGITSICSANNFVINAAIEHAVKRNRLLCMESTGRQVNQYGGYSGMQPKQFVQNIGQIAEMMKLGKDHLILGGDHLGPDAWAYEDSDTAMSKACELVHFCVNAGYRKLHLDPSMPCRDDIPNGPDLSIKTIADRTALLCETAEKAAEELSIDKTRLLYVVGSEVPTPGGILEEKNNGVHVSTVKNAKDTISIMRQTFIEKGLESAWDRCIALVVETGATFGQDEVRDYESRNAEDLRLFIENEKDLVFEAHSTDFQTQQSLADMVRDHFAILKVGPWLTFTVREALYALEYIEREWLAKRRGITLSGLSELMMEIMNTNNTHWQKHYHGDEAYLQYIKAYGFSDRIRYYWSDKRCSKAIARLFQNLTEYKIPLPLLSQYMPVQYEAVREGRLQCTPHRLVYGKIEEVLDKYAKACGDYEALLEYD